MGQGRTKGEDPSLSQKCKHPKWVTKGQRNKLCFRALTSHKKHMKERKGKET